MLELDGVVKRYPAAGGSPGTGPGPTPPARKAATACSARVVVLDGISGTLRPGVTLLTGANGAGKSTLLRLLAGILRPDAGVIRWRGRPLGDQIAAYRRRLGYLPQRQATYPELPVADFLDYMAALKALPPALATLRRNELLAALGLAESAREPIARLPHGLRQLVGLAQALLNDPDVLLLDEPLEGLDHEHRRRALALVHRPGRVTVLAAHRDEGLVPGLVAVWHLDAGRLRATAVNAEPSGLVPT